MERIRNGRDVRKLLRKNDIEIRSCKGSHRVATMPNGSKLVYHEHGEYGKGMRCKIIKALTAAGLLLMAACFLELI